MFKAQKKNYTLAGLPLVLLLVLSLGIVMWVGGCGSQPSPAPETGPQAEPTDEGPANGEAVDEFIILATTTSTYDSGLLDEVLPVFEEKYGTEVRVLSMGTGASLETGQRGDADVLLVHDRASELRMVEEGYFVDRYDVMYNDFVIVGPPGDPAGISALEKTVQAFEAIAQNENIFVSRGDDSGTNRAELTFWENTGITDRGDWYKAVGQGMGDTLRVAHEMEGYTLTDRATYLSLKDTLELDILLEGDPELFNQYGIMAVNPDLHPHVKYQTALLLIEFFNSEEGQDLITGFQIGGEGLFFPGLGLEG